MRKNLKWLGLGGILATMLLFAVSLPSKASSFDREATVFGMADELFESCMVSVKKDCESWAAQGGGSEAPRGLSVESKVELAQGEKYILSGNIEITETEVFLRISFHDQPWLASRTRIANPYYRINDDVALWKKLHGRAVTLIATARYSVFVGKDGQSRLGISLDPVVNPIIEALQLPKSR